jgi:peptide chain release factor 1
MHKKIKEIIIKYEDITKMLNLASLSHDSLGIQKLSKELGSISDLYQNALKLKSIEKDINDAKALLETEDDLNLKEYYSELLDSSIRESDILENELLNRLKTIDPNDSRPAIIEIRAGTGGEEAALFASLLYRMYLRYSEMKTWKVEQLSLNHAEQGGIKEVICLIDSAGAYGELKNESGVHRVQRIPITEAAGRIHTSSASVVVLPKVEDSEINISEDDLKIDIFRAGGPGGQGVNTTDSAVRITHIPTGIVVSCQDERSQLKNKNRALSILKSRLYDLNESLNEENLSLKRKSAIKSGDRSDKIKTYNFPQSRLTDHRIKHSWFNLSEILDGNLEEIISTTKKELSSGDVTE